MRLVLSNRMGRVRDLAVGSVGAVAQEPLTLRQAIQQALKQNPDVDVARAGTQEAKAGAALARTQLLPHDLHRRHVAGQ